MQPSAQLGSHSGVDGWVCLGPGSLFIIIDFPQQCSKPSLVDDDDDDYNIYIYICCLNGVMLPKIAGIIIYI